MYYTVFKSKIGDLLLVANEDGLFRIDFFTSNKINIKNDWVEQSNYFTDIKNQLNEYFNNKRSFFDIKLNIQGTEFQKQVWAVMAKIPYGQTLSYKQVAEKINNPKAVRAVGGACNKNNISIVLPCHRVVGANGSLTGFAGGLSTKQILLDIENKPTII